MTFRFRHEAPNCYILMPSQGKTEQGAYFMSTCSKCEECNADGMCYRTAPYYDREVQELECIILAMNGGKMLSEYRGKE